MKAPIIEWLESQLNKAKEEKESADRRFETAQTEKLAAQKRFEACSEMLAVAKQAQESEIKAAVKQRGRDGGSGPKVSMPDHMAELIKEHGALSSSEIYELLKDQGWEKTSVNSVNTQLSRHKGSRFNKNETGKWSLIDTA